MSITSYPPPVDKLLTYGDCRELRDWPDYLALGFGPEHIPDLIRMALDEDLNKADSESLKVWAPVHAWRALGQLRAEAAVEPLMRLFRRIDEDEDDWVSEELPIIFGQIGPVAIHVLATYLADKAHGLYARSSALECIEEIGKQHPESRAECVTAFTRQLEQFAENDPTLNGFIIWALIDLKAVESVSVIERAFAAGRVDEFAVGNWEEVQIDLGLKPIPEQPQKESGLKEALGLVPDSEIPSPVRGKAKMDYQHQSPSKAKPKVKAKRKQQKLSRKKNRKR